MFYHFANVICFHVLPIRMHQFKIGQCGINLVHMNEECYLFICLLSANWLEGEFVDTSILS